MRGLTLLLAVALLTACGAGQGGRPTTPSTDPGAAAVAWLQGVQRDGYERHDLAAYMGQWAPGATLTAARGPKPGPYDRTLDLATIRATRSERFCRKPTDGRTLTWQDVRVTLTSKTRAVVAWKALSRHSDGAELVAETYVLVRTPAGWRVSANRFWPIWTEETGRKRRTFDAATWRKLDNWAARKACFGGRCPSRLLSAWRFEEAWQESKRMSERPGGASAHGWLLRGLCAVLSGHVADAKPSFDRARQMDPKISLPAWRSTGAACTPASR